MNNETRLPNLGSVNHQIGKRGDFREICIFLKKIVFLCNCWSKATCKFAAYQKICLSTNQKRSEFQIAHTRPMRRSFNSSDWRHHKDRQTILLSSRTTIPRITVCTRLRAASRPRSPRHELAWHVCLGRCFQRERRVVGRRPWWFRQRTWTRRWKSQETT